MELREKIRELEFKESETVALRKEIQQMVRNGATTGRLAVDYLAANGSKIDEKQVKDIETYQAKLKAFAGETAIAVITKLFAKEKESGTEIRLCQLPGSPAIRFDENGRGGWLLGVRYAAMLASDRHEHVYAEPLVYSSTTGYIYPNDARCLQKVDVHLGNAAVDAYFKSGGAFGVLDHPALIEKLGLPLPTAKHSRSPTLQGI